MVSHLTDDRLLALCDLRMPDDRAAEMSSLLERGSEGELDEGGRRRLDTLLSEYGEGLLLKAEALAEAVGRGLIAPLNPRTRTR